MDAWYFMALVRESLREQSLDVELLTENDFEVVIDDKIIYRCHVDVDFVS